MKIQSRHSPEEGFTLVELMVVVAIIGVLSAIAVPNFKKYQAKAKTSEAKIHLAAAYTALQSFYSDYDTYHNCLSYMGYNPSNEADQRYYAVGFYVAAAAGLGTIATANGVDATACPLAVSNGRTFFRGEKSLGSTPQFNSLDVTTAVDEDTFTLGASGIIDDGFVLTTNSSAFTLNEMKKLIQVRAGY